MSFGVPRGHLPRKPDLQRFVRFKRLALVAVGGVLIAAAGAWLSFQHIPPWYRPLWLTGTQAQAVREEAEQTFEMASGKMVAGAPFSVSFSEQQINDMLSAQQVIWPAALSALGPGLADPCVDVEPGHIKIGLRWRRGEIRTVLNNRVVLQEADGELTLKSAGARAGSLPIPASTIWERFVDRPATGNTTPLAAQPAPRRVDTLSGALYRLLVDGKPLSLAGVFYWPNGDIPFTISDLQLQRDRITVSLQPLAD